MPRVEVKCEQCGEQFERYAGPRLGRAFCSSECYGEWQRTHYSADQEDLRRYRRIGATLKRGGIRTRDQLRVLTPQELRRIRYIAEPTAQLLEALIKADDP